MKIKNKEEYDVIMSRLHDIFLTKDDNESIEAGVLFRLIEEYEAEHFPIEAPDTSKIAEMAFIAGGESEHDIPSYTFDEVVTRARFISWWENEFGTKIK